MNTLCDDPHPGGSRRKRLHQYDDVHRLRINDCRVFYQIHGCSVVLLAVDHPRNAYRREELPDSREFLVLIENPEAEALAEELTTGHSGEETGSVASHRIEEEEPTRRLAPEHETAEG